MWDGKGRVRASSSTRGGESLKLLGVSLNAVPTPAMSTHVLGWSHTYLCTSRASVHRSLEAELLSGVGVCEVKVSIVCE